jgi:CBS domain-containing protein
MPANQLVRELLRDQHWAKARAETTVREAAKLMATRGCTSVAVMAGEELCGIFTARDLLSRVVAPGLDLDTTQLKEVMTREPDTISAEAPVRDAIRMFDELGYEHLPVLEGERLVGVISIKDLLSADIISMLPELEARHAITEHLR